jgi:peptide/nickel transport system permease protein
VTRYSLHRLMWVAFVILVVTLITFVIFYVMPPGNPATRFAGKQPTPEIIAEVEKRLGLDRPLHVQYALFVKRLFTGDEYGWPGLGFSYDSSNPVRDELIERAPRSLFLVAGAAVVWLLMGIPIGLVSALRRRSIADRAAMGFALFGISAPVFWLALMALFVFWETLGVQSMGTGYVPLTEDPWLWLMHMVMPWTVVALLFAAFYARMVRGNLIDTMSEDFIRTARAKGLSERQVVMKHGLRASLTPVVTMFGMDIGLLIGGTVVSETVFNIQGLGQWTVSAVFAADLPVIVAVTLVATFAVTFMNLVVDLLYAYLDPRVRFA